MSKYNIDEKEYYYGWLSPSKDTPMKNYKKVLGDQKKTFDEIPEEKLSVYHTYDIKFDALVHWTQKDGYRTKIAGVEYIEECFQFGVEKLKKKYMIKEY